MAKVINERKYDGVEERLPYKGCTWGQRQEDTGCKEKEEDSCEERHHRMKHGSDILPMQKIIRSSLGSLCLVRVALVRFALVRFA